MEKSGTTYGSIDALPPPPGSLLRSPIAGLAGNTAECTYPHVPGYDIQAVLGRGGMGVVYKAWQRGLNRHVALKMVLAGSHAGMEERLRFQIEAEAVAQMQHPNIVQIHDIGTHDGVPYFSLEYIDGGTLRQRLRADPPTANEAAGMVRQLALAIHFAHLRNIVHRDLKPANILMQRGEGCGARGDRTADDSPLAPRLSTLIAKITDFGLAKRMDGVREQTQSGGILGTPGYMSPEQAEGRKDVGPATDIYSLGAIFYEMLSGNLPFPGNSVAQVLERVRHEDPLPPRKLNPRIPRDLETICLKCLKKDPALRYASAQELADDLDRYSRHEPIRARPVSVGERLWKWMRRHPVRATFMAVLAVTLAAGWIIYQRQQAARADDLVESLTTADTARVPEIVKQLAPYRGQARERLERLIRDTPEDSKEHLHASLALVDEDSDQVFYLESRLLTATPEELLVIREAVQGRREVVIEPLWQVLQGQSTERPRRLRAGCALAALADPCDPRWEAVAADLADSLILENPLLLGKWTEAVRPIGGHLVDPLAAAFRGPKRSDAERSFALSMLADFAADRPELLVDLLLETSERQFPLWWPAVERQKDRAVAVLARELELALPPPRQLEAHDREARRQAIAAAALVRLREDNDKVWSLLRHSDDPSRRTYFMHALGRLGCNPARVWRRLELETDVSARRALILALGEFTPEQLAPVSASDKNAAKTLLLLEYDLNPDPGIHSAIGWLLGCEPTEDSRRVDWKQSRELQSIDQKRATGAPVEERQWYVTRTEGYALAVIPRPPRCFETGSPQGEPGRMAEEESACAVTIPRSFAIATREVTVAQFERYLKDPSCKHHHTFDRALCPDDNAPALGLSWFEAAQYCNWLSKQEEIPQSEWCYPADDKIGPGMMLPADYLHRKGYRLPSEAEWEYACRAGARTSRFYGTSGSWLREYAWFADTANRHALPVGQLKPNDLGLFDVYGNAMEWCHDRGRRGTPGSAPITEREDTEDDELRVSDAETRVLRGGSFWYLERSVRSAYRDHQLPVGHVIAVGLRVARTMP